MGPYSRNRFFIALLRQRGVFGKIGMLLQASLLFLLDASYEPQQIAYGVIGNALRQQVQPRFILLQQLYNG